MKSKRESKRPHKMLREGALIWRKPFALTLPHLPTLDVLAQKLQVLDGARWNTDFGKITVKVHFEYHDDILYFGVRARNWRHVARVNGQGMAGSPLSVRGVAGVRIAPWVFLNLASITVLAALFALSGNLPMVGGMGVLLLFEVTLTVGNLFTSLVTREVVLNELLVILE